MGPSTHVAPHLSIFAFMGSAAGLLSKNKDEKTGAFSGLMVVVSWDDRGAEKLLTRLAKFIGCSYAQPVRTT
jgi:hypothetical protein